MAKREFSAGGIVIKRERGRLKVLLIKDGYGRWTWPKGNIGKGESSEDAALREIKEETGLKKLQIVEKINEINYFYRPLSLRSHLVPSTRCEAGLGDPERSEGSRLHGDLIFKTVYLFLVKAKGKEPLKIQASEIQDAKWLTPEEALKTVAYKGAKEILKKAIKIIRGFSPAPPLRGICRRGRKPLF